MRHAGSATADDMVLAFLQAEVDSPRFHECIGVVLEGDLTVVHDPKDTAEENTRRRHVLACCRGFEMNTYLFRGFPADPEWARIMATREEIGNLQYANHPTWNALSEGSRLVRDGASNVGTAFHIDEDPRVNIQAVASRVAAGRRYPALILAATHQKAQHVIAEGHTRATAYFLKLPDDEEIEMIVAYSPHLTEWSFH